ncbi:MAG TPA: peptide deformylase [Candidatus Saccharimonadales bacterium]|nr:peptide deformylase [Candidatus Saccharimonadales bacterium]
MAHLKIVRLGHPALRNKSKTVSNSELKTNKFQSFLDNLAEICEKNAGAGIAAPQVDVNKRVIVIYVDPKNPRYPDKKPFPLTIIINPKIVKKSKQVKEDWEGDLSCNFRAMVPRSVSCEIVGLNRKAELVRFILKNDFHARVFQHEIDHLDGVFLIDKVKKMETISEYAEWKKYWKNRKSTKLN